MEGGPLRCGDGVYKRVFVDELWGGGCSESLIVGYKYAVFSLLIM